MQRIPQLDGVRGIAILLVLIWHSVSQMGPQAGFPLGYLSRAISLCWSGVDLFFVLSGFLIGGILLDTKQSPNYLSRFYVRRFFRIVPVYLVAVAAGLLLSTPERPMLGALWYFTFTQNFWMSLYDQWSYWLSISWSLAVEEQFYLFLPFVVLAIATTRSLAALLIALVGAALLIRVAIFTTSDHYATANYVLFPCRMDSLLIGVLAAMLVRVEWVREWMSQNVPFMYGALAALLLVPMFMIFMAWGDASPFTLTVGLTLLALLYAVFLLVAVFDRSGPVSWLTNQPTLRYLGIGSYFIYLAHLMFIGLMPRTVIGVGSGVGLTLIAAAISWRYFERPLINLGHRLTQPAPIIRHRRTPPAPSPNTYKQTTKLN